MSNVYPCARIGSAGTSGDERDARSTRELPIGFGHHRRTPLVTTGYHLNVWRVMEFVQNGHETFTRHTKDPFNPVQA